MAPAISRVRNVPEAPTSVPATSSSVLDEDVAAGGDGQAGERVEQRDDDRHVGAADRQHQQDADEQADQAEHDAEPHRRARGPAAPTSTTAPIRLPPKSTGRPGKTTGREVISSWSLAKVMIEPANDTAPTRIVNAVATSTNVSRSKPEVVELDDLVQLDQRHQGGRAAADAVEQRHHLRHLGHLDAAGAVDAARGADRDRGQDQRRRAACRRGRRTGSRRRGRRRRRRSGCRSGRSSARTAP